MFVALLVVFASLIAATSASNWILCHPQEYCAPMQNLVTQKGSYATPEDCGTQCLTIGSTWTFFSYVNSSKQCLCTQSCESQISNSGVDSYCLNITWKDCADGKYCNDPSLKPQVGTFGNPQDCANQCWWLGGQYKYFNLVTSSGQCQCLSECSSMVAAQSVSTYSLNDNACPVVPTNNLRQA
jgi:hypothetical protein